VRACGFIAGRSLQQSGLLKLARVIQLVKKPHEMHEVRRAGAEPLPIALSSTNPDALHLVRSQYLLWKELFHFQMTLAYTLLETEL
jgi:hypothetical protein